MYVISTIESRSLNSYSPNLGWKCVFLLCPDLSYELSVPAISNGCYEPQKKEEK